MWREMGMWVLVLAGIVIFGRMWFHLVEWMLAKLKSLLNRNKKSSAWHTFEETDDENSGVHRP